MREYLSGLSERDRAVAADAFTAILRHGLAAPGIRFRQVRGRLWEFRIEGYRSHRVFYVLVQGPMLVLLHAYRKQGQKAPRREVETATRRMKEVLDEA